MYGEWEPAQNRLASIVVFLVMLTVCRQIRRDSVGAGEDCVDLVEVVLGANLRFAWIDDGTDDPLQSCDSLLQLLELVILHFQQGLQFLIALLFHWDS